MDAVAAKYLAAALCMGVGGFGAALGIAIIAKAALQSIGRNPEAKDPITTNMILAIAFTEAMGIFSLIIAIMLLLVV